MRGLCQKDKQVKEIICCVRNIQKAKVFLPGGFKKIVLKEIDVIKEKKRLLKEISGVDLVVNAASSRINLQILDAAYRAGVNYMDLASHHLHNPFKAEQFEFDGKFKRKGLKGLICAGIAPGISNLLIRQLAEKFDAVDGIKLRLAENMVSEDIISSWSPDLAIEELADDVPVYKKGHFVLKEPFSGEEIYDYGEPFGKMAATMICQDEQVTVPRFIKINNMDVKSGGSDIEAMKLFYRLGFFAAKPVTVGGEIIYLKDLLKKIMPPTPSPKEMMHIIRKGRINEALFGIVVEVNGRKKGKKLKVKSRLICPSIFEINKLMPGATYISYPTGLAAYLFIKALAHADFSGVLSPEGLDSKIGFAVLRDFIKKGKAKVGTENLK